MEKRDRLLGSGAVDPLERKLDHRVLVPCHPAALHSNPRQGWPAPRAVESAPEALASPCVGRWTRSLTPKVRKASQARMVPPRGGTDHRFRTVARCGRP